MNDDLGFPLYVELDADEHTVPGDFDDPIYLTATAVEAAAVPARQDSTMNATTSPEPDEDAVAQAAALAAADQPEHEPSLTDPLAAMLADSAVFGSVPDPLKARQASQFGETYFAIGERVALYYGDRLAYRASDKSWYAYTGTHWVRDEIDLALAWVRTTIRSISTLEPGYVEETSEVVQQAAADLATGRANGWPESAITGAEYALREAKKKARAQRLKFAERAESVKSATDMALAALKTLLTVPEERWDSHPWLVNAPNGTFEIHKGVLREHRQSDYITKVTAVDIDLTAKSVDLEKVLAHFELTAPGTRKAAVRYGGLCITGAMEAKTYVNAFGPPDAAKSTFWTAIYEALGGNSATSYAGTVSPEVLSIKDDGGSTPRPALDALRGKRYGLVAEAEHLYIASGLMKRITGGDPINTRSLRENGSSWFPQLKLVIIGNGMSAFNVDDTGMLKRLWPLLVHAIPEGQKDDQIKHRLEKTEEGRKAVLAVLVQGAMAWYRAYKIDGLGAREALAIPDFFEKKKKEAVADINPLSGWAEDYVRFFDADLDDEHDYVGRSTTEMLHRSYLLWVKRHAGEPMSLKKFARYLTAMGTRVGNPEKWQATTSRGAVIHIKGKPRLGIRMNSETIWGAVLPPER